MSALRGVLTVAAFDLRESFRSRKVLVLLVLFAGIAVAGTAIYADVLRSLEAELGAALGVAATERPGAMTQGLAESAEYRQLVAKLAGDEHLGRSLAELPPLALFFGWLVLLVMPAFAVLSSVDAIAADVSTGASRYALVRVDRLPWALGKLLGQAVVLGAGLLVAAVTVTVAGAVLVASIRVGDTLLATVALLVRFWVYGFAYLGLALGISQATRSVQWARVLGLGALLAVGLARWTLDRVARSHAPDLADALLTLLPGSHAVDLWRPDALDRLGATSVLLAFGVLTFALGHLRFARRDA